MIDLNERVEGCGSLKDKLKGFLIPQTYYANSIQEFRDNYYRFDVDGRRTYALKPTKKFWLPSFNGKSLVMFPNLKVDDEVVVSEVGKFFKFYDTTDHFVGGLQEAGGASKDPYLCDPKDVREGQRIYLPCFIFDPQKTFDPKLFFYQNILATSTSPEKSFSLASLCSAFAD